MRYSTRFTIVNRVFSHSVTLTGGFNTINNRYPQPISLKNSYPWTPKRIMRHSTMPSANSPFLLSYMFLSMFVCSFIVKLDLTCLPHNGYPFNMTGFTYYLPCIGYPTADTIKYIPQLTPNVY